MMSVGDRTRTLPAGGLRLVPPQQAAVVAHSSQISR
jgi:hypothetical protein